MRSEHAFISRNHEDDPNNVDRTKSDDRLKKKVGLAGRLTLAGAMIAGGFGAETIAQAGVEQQQGRPRPERVDGDGQGIKQENRELKEMRKDLAGLETALLQLQTAFAVGEQGGESVWEVDFVGLSKDVAAVSKKDKISIQDLRGLVKKIYEETANAPLDELLFKTSAKAVKALESLIKYDAKFVDMKQTLNNGWGRQEMSGDLYDELSDLVKLDKHIIRRIEKRAEELNNQEIRRQ